MKTEICPRPLIVYPPSYNYCMYDHVKFKRKVKQLIGALRKCRLKQPFDAVVVTGKSGLAYAFGILMDTNEFPIITVRKPGESSHGTMVEGASSTRVGKYIFLDDCIDTGTTFKRVKEAIADKCGNVFDVPECVGIMLHAPIRTKRKFGGVKIFPSK